MTNRVLAREYFPEEILSLDLNDKRFVYELSVPTCSYRMGVERMGYGVLLLDSGKRDLTFECVRFDACFCLATKTAHLAILSTPQRYFSLYFYAAYGVFVVLSLIITSLFPRRTLLRLLTFR